MTDTIRLTALSIRGEILIYMFPLIELSQILIYLFPDILMNHHIPARAQGYNHFGRVWRQGLKRLWIVSKFKDEN